MTDFLIAIQDSVFSVWTRESSWALFAFLIVHTIGMAFLVGTGVILNLRVLGVAYSAPLTGLARFMPTLYSGLLAAILSGILLVISYPAKALTNPLFYVKLVLLTVAVALTRRLVRHSAGGDGSRGARGVAVLSLLFWVAGVVLGKLLAYTNRDLLLY